MCIICVKTKGNQFPSLERVQNMCDNNGDGFAMAYYTPKGVTIFKTLKKDEFISKYKEVMKLDKDKTSLIIHTRIKTHGTMRVENCHCWRDKKTGLVFAHNGILSIANRDDMTDSETFFRDIFVPIYRLHGWEGAKKAINAVIASSKFAFLTQRGDIVTFGNYVDGKDGCFYSNTTYLKRTYSYGRYWDEAWGKKGAYGRYGFGYGSNHTKKHESETLTDTFKKDYSYGLKDESIWSASERRTYYKSVYKEKDYGLTWSEFKEKVEQDNEEYYRLFAF